MERTPRRPTFALRRLLRAAEVPGLVLLAYAPFLASSRGRVSADTKQYLYLDPRGLLERAPYLWDPSVAAGTVPHQQIGYLFPMGPWYWAFDVLGVPDWVAQRLWLGTISLAAVLGARWLLRSLGASACGALAGALVYLWTPYQLAFTARISVLLLAWAGLPWLVGLTMRAVKGGGWRHPALFALVILTIGSVNASTLVFVLIGPALWLVVALCTKQAGLRSVVAAGLRITVLTIGVSVWWIAGLRLQGTYGLPVLRLTESLSWVAAASRPDDVLRGLGNWFFYGEDRAGPAVDQALDYLLGGRVGLASYAVPVVALACAAAVRWRHRAYALLLVIVGTVVAVGSWPYDELTPYGRVWKAFAEDSSLGLALRNSPRVVPLVVLGMAALLAAGITAQPTARRRWAAASLVAILAAAAIGPVWRTGFLSDGLDRPEEVPAYWREAAAAMDREGHRTRVLEIPGANFAGYRWGNAIEPITPGLTDRPYVAREVLPYGSPPSVNLLDALDRRFQSGTFEPVSLAPIARLFAAGTVALRADLQADRFDSAPPSDLWAALTDPPAPGLEHPRRFGPAVGEASTGATGAPPSVALFDVEDPVPIVRTAPLNEPVVLAGDGDGIVDAAAAGLVDGRALLLTLASLDEDGLRQALDERSDLMLTDSNRRRVQHWFFSVRRNKGPTERAGVTTPDPEGLDHRLEVVPGAGDDARTVTEHVGGRVDASADGGPARPEDRAVYAFDGDLRTSWRVGGADPTGERIVLETDHPVRTDHITLVQPQEGPRDRVLTRVRMRLDGDSAFDADLGPASLEPSGQVVRFPRRTIRRVEIELAATSRPSIEPALANAVGFAEARLGDVRVSETVRMPVDLAERTGAAASGNGLDVVMSRLRVDPRDRTRQDEELRLDRRFMLPDQRVFSLSGTARVNPNAPDPVLDDVLATTATGATFSASSHRHGDAAARASRAFDGDATTAWTSAVGPQEGQSLAVRLGAPVSPTEMEATFMVDENHSVPTRLRVEADGVAVATARVPEGGNGGGSQTVRLPLEGVPARDLRLVVEDVARRTRVPGDPNPFETLPVAFTEVEFGGVPEPRAPTAVESLCREDLVRVDGRVVPVRVSEASGGGAGALELESCAGPLSLGAGSHRLRSAIGLDAGIDVDRVVLASGPDGRARAVSPRGARRDTSGAEATPTTGSRTALDLEVRTDGAPFWVVLGVSESAGWEAEASAGSLGPRNLTDGYANGWIVRPSQPGAMEVELNWRPQRLVWAALALSALAVVLCCAILVTPLLLRRRPSTAPSLSDVAVLRAWGSTGRHRAPWGATVAVAAASGIVVTFFSRPWIGVAVAAAVLVAAAVPWARLPVALAAPAALVLCRLTDTPEWAWLAVGLLVADLVAGTLSETRRRAEPEPVA